MIEALEASPQEVAIDRQVRELFRTLWPLVKAGATTHQELAQLISQQRKRLYGEAISARDQSRLDTLRGMANLIASFGQRSLREDRPIA